MATAVIAMAAFLGLGGILGQWAVSSVQDTIRGTSPPPGLEELHAAWTDTASLNERLLAAGEEANRQLAEGVPFAGLRILPPDLEDDLVELRAIRSGASDLAGRVRAISTDLAGQRADLVRLLALVRTTTQRVLDGILDAYQRSGGEPIYGGSGGFAPIFSNELRRDVQTQDAIVTQVAAGLEPVARRFELLVPDIRGWNRLPYPYADSDTPRY